MMLPTYPAPQGAIVPVGLGATTPDASTGMSTGAKVALGVLAFAAVGGVAWVVTRSNKSARTRRVVAHGRYRPWLVSYMAAPKNWLYMDPTPEGRPTEKMVNATSRQNAIDVLDRWLTVHGKERLDWDIDARPL